MNQLSVSYLLSLNLGEGWNTFHCFKRNKNTVRNESSQHSTIARSLLHEQNYLPHTRIHGVGPSEAHS